MKNFTIAACLFLVTLPAVAQRDSIGVYLSATDFKNHKLSYVSGSDSSEKIKSSNLFHPNSFVVKEGHKKTRLQKSTVYGFHTSQGDFRFYNREVYRVINVDGLSLYSRTVVKQGKGYSTETDYYFSVDANSALQELTVTNLKNAFPGNFAFHDALDIHIHTKSDLTAFDNYRKQYTIVHLFTETVSLANKGI